MHFVAGLALFSFITQPSASIFPRVYNSIDSNTYSDLVRYAKYSSGAYQDNCEKPMGNTRVYTVCHISLAPSRQTKNTYRLATPLLTPKDTLPLIRLEKRQWQLSVALCNFMILLWVSFIFLLSLTLTQPHAQPDFTFPLEPFTSPGVFIDENTKPRAHRGFLNAYNSVADDIFKNVKLQLEECDGCKIITTGSLSALCPTNVTQYQKQVIPWVALLPPLPDFASNHVSITPMLKSKFRYTPSVNLSFASLLLNWIVIWQANLGPVTPATQYQQSVLQRKKKYSEVFFKVVLIVHSLK